MEPSTDLSLKCALTNKVDIFLQVFPVILKNLIQSAIIRSNTVCYHCSFIAPEKTFSVDCFRDFLVFFFFFCAFFVVVFF